MENFTKEEALRKPLIEDEQRAQFIRKTYSHVALALLSFVVLEFLIQQWSGVEELAFKMVSGYNWLIVIGLAYGGTWLSTKWAMSSYDQGRQYAGLFLYTIVEAIIFIPIIHIATAYSSPDVLGQAALMTGFLFVGLTLVVFVSRKDFSFMRSILSVGFMLALGAIVVGLIFGFDLGLGFSILMVGLAAGAILYQTSNILHTYHPSQHVAAALGLFSAIMMLFFYILRIFMSRD